MRVMIGMTVLLAGCVGALAQPAGREAALPPPASSAEQAAPTLPALNDEARARQAAVDQRIGVRNRRAMGSVCRGCDGPAGRAARVRGEADGAEVPIRDPAQAPVD